MGMLCLERRLAYNCRFQNCHLFMATTTNKFTQIHVISVVAAMLSPNLYSSFPVGCTTLYDYQKAQFSPTHRGRRHIFRNISDIASRCRFIGDYNIPYRRVHYDSGRHQMMALSEFITATAPEAEGSGSAQSVLHTPFICILPPYVGRCRSRSYVTIPEPQIFVRGRR